MRTKRVYFKKFFVTNIHKLKENMITQQKYLSGKLGEEKEPFSVVKTPPQPGIPGIPEYVI
jgi:hypothetical protein